MSDCLVSIQIWYLVGGGDVEVGVELHRDLGVAGHQRRADHVGNVHVGAGDSGVGVAVQESYWIF